MIVAVDPIARWKTPNDLRRWLSDRFERIVTAELRAPGARIDAFAIGAPGLTADFIARRFADVRSWADDWLTFAAAEAEFDLTMSDRRDRRFGAVHIPKSVHVRSIEAAARLVHRTGDLAMARDRHAALKGTDARLADMAVCWPLIGAISDDDFGLLLQFAREAARLDISRLRLREVSIAGMHTKFLEDHRTILKPLLFAMNVPLRPDARTWAGRLGFFEDDTAMIELRDLDGDLLPYSHLAVPCACLVEKVPTMGGHLRSVVVVENKATFMALPPTPGALAIFGQGGAVRALSATRWLRDQRLLYSGDLDHAGYQMVAGLRRDGLAHLETALMDIATAEANRRYWVADTSTPGTDRVYEGLTEAERAAWRLMAAGPWRLEQERIPFDVLAAELARWDSQSRAGGEPF